MPDTVRCWQCGKSTPEEQVARRDVKTAGLRGFVGHPFALSNWLFGSSYSRVDLCPACAAENDKLVASDRSPFQWLKAFAIVIVVLGVVGFLISRIAP